MAVTSNKQAYSGGTQITATLASLGISSSRETNSQSNLANLYFDYLVSVTFTIASGTPSTAGPAVNVWANASIDGTLWPRIQLSSGAVYATTGADASVGIIGTVPNLKLIGSFGMQATASAGERTFRTPPYSVAAQFGYVCPPAFNIIIENQSGVVFSTSTLTTANYVEINGVYWTSGG